MKKEMKIDERKAIALYPTASENLKKELEEIFGKDVLTDDITKKVTDMNSACKQLGINPKERIPYPNPKNDFEEAINCQAVRVTIAEALQQGKAGWWEPIFKKSGKSGFVLSLSATGYDGSFTVAGARLSFPTEKISNYFGSLDIHNKFLTNNQIK